jgi:simple sugar transport system permease protein
VKSGTVAGEILKPVLAALVGLLLGVGITWLSGEDPLHVAGVLFDGAFGSSYSLGMTLFYTTPLIFTGLAVALPFHAGLFNIGAEGQLLAGALGAVTMGILMPEGSGLLAVLTGTTAGFAGGAAFGWIAGWIRARRGGHEVISTIMLNFVAAGLTSWAVLYLLKSTDTQNPESQRIAESMLLTPYSWFEGAPVTAAFPVAIIVCVLVWFLLTRTVFGFELTATGQNPEAARVSGVDTARIRIWAMALAGGLAGLVGLAEVFGNSGRFKLGFSADYGFIGIPVALLARCHPVGVIFSALLFGALHKGSSELDLETDYVTRDVSYLIQAMVILAVSADGVWWLKNRLGLGRNKEVVRAA